MGSLFLFIAALYVLSGDPVSLRIWPGWVQQQPAQYTFVMVMDRHVANREACFAYDGAEAWGFCWDVDAKSPRSYRFVRTIRHGGDYLATATVRRIEDGRATAYVSRQPFRVIGMEP